jgi:cytochrome c biogenesis protein ResB
LGIALIIIAMILGYFSNWRGKAVLLHTDKTNVFINQNKELKVVPFALTLSKFNVTFYETGEPKSYEAIITVEKNDNWKNQKSITLSINHPCKMGFGQDLYLINYDRENRENPEFCVVELVYDPFQGLFLAGIILLILGMIWSLVRRV